MTTLGLVYTLWDNQTINKGYLAQTIPHSGGLNDLMSTQPQLESSPLHVMSDLDDAIKNNTSTNQIPKYGDRMAFLILLKNLLHLDPEKRMTPSKALRHPFITIEYLVEDKTDYAEWARDIMTFTLRDVTPGCAPQDRSRTENSKN